MGAFYQLLIYSASDGTGPPYFRLQSIIDPQEFKWSFRYRRALNTESSFTAILPFTATHQALFSRNSLVHIQRKLAIDDTWSNEATYIIKYRRVKRADYLKFTIGGPSLEWMANSQDIVPAATDTDGYSSKSDTADRVMKQFVSEQIGISANDPYARFPELAVEGFKPAAGAGLDVSLSGRYGNKVLDMLRSAAEEGRLDFWFRFDQSAGLVRFETGIVGTDRTVSGNPGGPYLLFSQNRGNVADSDEIDDWRKACTKAYILGAGAGAEQEVEQYPAAGMDIMTGSGRWDRSTVAVNAQRAEAGDTVALRTAGVDALEQNKPIRTLEFSARQLDGARYGKDWFLGDIVTAERLDGDFVDYRITAIEVWLSGSGSETIEPTFTETL